MDRGISKMSRERQDIGRAFGGKARGSVIERGRKSPGVEFTIIASDFDLDKDGRASMDIAQRAIKFLNQRNTADTLPPAKD